jgi:cytochrome c oxidase cbb3-type subunit 1
MDWFVRAFIKSSVSWLALGVTLGVAIAVHPAWIVYRPAHFHMTLLGFVTMMIFGVAYHVIPRFSGSPLRHRTLAAAHWWIANVGLALMIIGFILRASTAVVAAVPTALLAAGGTLSSLGAYAFGFNIWRTLSASPSAPEPVRASPLLKVARTP